MSNKIKVRRGTDTARQSATIDNYEIHYSTGNTGDGQAERLWVADSNASNATSNDLLIGPYEFVSGHSQITVSTDYTTGRVSIGYQDAASFNPSQSLTAVASTYANNSTIEAGDTFGGNHTLTVTTGTGSNEVLIDQAGYTYDSLTGYFASPLNLPDGITLASGSQSLSWAQSVATPSGFSTSSINDRRTGVVIFCNPASGSGFSQDSSTKYFNWGWRVAGFLSTTDYTSSPTTAQILSTSGSNLNQFNVVQQTPTNATTRNWVLPNDGSQWYPYLVHSCSPNGGSDDFGWTPSATVVGSGSIGLSEVTDLSSDVVIGSLGGQANTKYYRVWRVGGASGYYGDGSTLSLSIS